MHKRPLVRRLSHSELLTVTNRDFSKQPLLGSGAHGAVRSVVLDVPDGSLHLAVKYSLSTKPAAIRDAHIWASRLSVYRSMNLSTVPCFQHIERYLIMTDLSIYGSVVDFNYSFDLRSQPSFRYLLLNMARQLAIIHASGCAVGDWQGRYGFRSWFLLTDVTHRPPGNPILTDVGGIVTFARLDEFNDTFFLWKSPIGPKARYYVKNNLLSLLRLVDFDPQLTKLVFDHYRVCLHVRSNLYAKHLKKISKELQKQLKRDSFMETVRTIFNPKNSVIG